ncbi:MAG: coiled coil domain-containing protein [Zetaproteobacteria bacterium CG12_big_fil_rev_8_21_14_0_65_54_13]|nr:MAG: coiled coil domain-containing protein [Zetaproteobacteria bacterium CG12_big_fil_rev_8_21_14_0_65_54_13]PIX53480.1 MAG: coiled coil domain-containing protein [Zetaproteobacteria bacterium CG_4_10_14_3_um_filter_54_28]PJA30913.1 MAG: coiled coil domain-containing protein [Zetaproteobacteria bacterium CG_4_9_14_3_um_filter_54_145]
MNEKELYQQKQQAQMDEWKAEADKLKAKGAGASADAQVALNKQIKAVEGKIEAGKSRLAEISDASEEAWDSMKSAFGDAVARLKK